MTDEVQDLGRPGDDMSEMRHVRLDAHTAEGLLTGGLTADDAPPAYAGVAALLGSARSAGVGAAWASSTALPGEAPTVGAMVAALALHDAPVIEERRVTRGSRPAKVLSLKAAVILSALLLGGGTAAAATGSLPGAAQATASEVLHDVGISVPGAKGDHEGHAYSEAASAGHGKGDEGHESSTTRDAHESSAGATKISLSKDEGKGPKSHALFGLCTARKANDGHAHADVFPSAAACASVTHPGDGGGDNHTSEPGTSTEQPQGPPTPQPGGQPSSTPGSDEAPVQTPNEGTASDTAPNGHGPGVNESRGDSASAGAGQNSKGH